MDRSSHTDYGDNLQPNPASYQTESNQMREEGEEEENKINKISIDIREDLHEEPIELQKYLEQGRISKAGIGKTCGCAIKSKLLSCTICHILRCKACVEKETNIKSNQKKGVKKYFYICKSCISEQEGKMRKHDMTCHFEKEPIEFLQKKHKHVDTEQRDDENSNEDSFEKDNSTSKKRKSFIPIKKKKTKVLPEKIYSTIEKKSLNYVNDGKDEVCIECNNQSPTQKVKVFASLEQLLYYLQYYYEDIHVFISENKNSNKIGYPSIISNTIMKEKGQKSFSVECHFILCRNCLGSLSKGDALEFASSLDKLIQKVHLLSERKVLEDNIFSTPGIYSKLSIIITQFLIVQGFSLYQKQFIQCLFSKIKSINEKISTNEYSNSNILKSILSSTSVNDLNLQKLQDNHLKSKELIVHMDELFSKFQDGSKDIFTSFALKSHDLDQIMNMLNNCFSILGKSTDAILVKDTNSLNMSKQFIESLIKKFKSIVSSNLGNSEGGGEMGSVNAVDSFNKSISSKDKDDSFTQDSWPFTMKLDELFPLMLKVTQQSVMPNNYVDVMLQPYQMNNVDKASYPLNRGCSNNNLIDRSISMSPYQTERPQIQNQIENVNVLFNNVPNFTLSLNNFSGSSASLPTIPPQYPQSLNQLSALYQLQQYQQILQQQMQLNPLNNCTAYPFYPMNPYRPNQP